jgi:hypothetical protein
MSSLNNLYISQSYQGLVHFGTNTTASATLGLIEDGLGNSLGLYLNNNGDLKTTTSISSSRIEATNLIIKNKVEVSGSVDVLNDVTASNAYLRNNLIVSGTIFAYQINTTIESSSVIFSSGSNILGDNVNDTQTLNGTIIMSGSNQLTGSLTVSNDISSSTLNGMGNVASFVTKMQSATSSLFTSASLGLTTASVNINVLTFTKGDGTQFNLTVAPISFNSGSYTLTSSFNAYTQSTNNTIAGLTTTASFNAYTQSTNNTIVGLATTASFNQYTSSNDTKWNTLQSVTQSLNSFTASQNNLNLTFATTGSNTFIGNEVYSGSVRGVVIPLTIASNTASMDLSLGNFFTLTLPTASTTYLNPTNIKPGETVQVLIKQQSVTGSLNYSTNFLFATGSAYSASIYSNAQDILSFVSFSTSSLYAVSIKNLV